jgi:hypothetical protein
MKTFTVGNVKLTQQAFAVFIIGSLMSVSGFFMLQSKKGIFLSVLMFAYTCYVTYLTNCVVVGDCNILAWLLVASSAVMALGTPMRLKSLRNI